MADQVTVLQLVLDRLQLGNSISSIDDRITIQKVVCLTQEAGLQLGYSFNWYVRGPYSPSLASDYYQIAGTRADVESEAKKFTLTDSAASAVEKVAALLQIPHGVTLTRVYWLELLASISFLNRRHKLSKDAAREKIGRSKPQLHPFFEQAWTALLGTGLVAG